MRPNVNKEREFDVIYSRKMNRFRYNYVLGNGRNVIKTSVVSQYIILAR